MQRHIISINTPTELGIVRHTDDRVSKTTTRQVVNEVNQTVFQPANIEAIDHMRNQGPWQRHG
jgi:hypothetical protein